MAKSDEERAGQKQAKKAARQAERKAAKKVKGQTDTPKKASGASENMTREERLALRTQRQAKKAARMAGKAEREQQRGAKKAARKAERQAARTAAGVTKVTVREVKPGSNDAQSAPVQRLVRWNT